MASTPDQPRTDSEKQKFRDLGGEIAVAILMSGEDGTTVDVSALADENHDIDGLNAITVASSVYGRIDDDTVKPIAMDSSTHNIQQISNEHHEIHDGNVYECTYYSADLDTAAVLDRLIVTPDTTAQAHLTFVVDGQLETLVEIFQNTTHTAGVVQRVINCNMNVADDNTTDVYLSNDDVADGTLRFEDRFGISTGSGANSVSGGGQSRGGTEYVLKRNTKYLFRVTSFTDNNVVSVKLRWYEHIPKG